MADQTGHEYRTILGLLTKLMASTEAVLDQNTTLQAAVTLLATNQVSLTALITGLLDQGADNQALLQELTQVRENLDIIVATI